MGRFVGTGLAHFFQADFILLVYAVISIILCIYVSFGRGLAAVVVLMALFFFESLMFPTIFVMGTTNLGRHTRRGAGIMIMGVSGGAIFPPIQGAIADALSTRISFLVPLVGFIVVLAYALFHWIKHGLKVRRISPAVGAVVEQERKPSESLNHLPSSKFPETYPMQNVNQTVITAGNH